MSVSLGDPLAAAIVAYAVAHPGATSNAIVTEVRRRRKETLAALALLEAQGVLRAEHGRRGAKRWFAAPDATDQFLRRSEPA